MLHSAREICETIAPRRQKCVPPPDRQNLLALFPVLHGTTQPASVMNPLLPVMQSSGLFLTFPMMNCSDNREPFTPSFFCPKRPRTKVACGNLSSTITVRPVVQMLPSHNLLPCPEDSLVKSALETSQHLHCRTLRCELLLCCTQAKLHPSTEDFCLRRILPEPYRFLQYSTLCFLRRSPAAPNAERQPCPEALPML
jgi:hypothetical protein